MREVCRRRFLLGAEGISQGPTHVGLPHAQPYLSNGYITDPDGIFSTEDEVVTGTRSRGFQHDFPVSLTIGSSACR